jgi:large subunit ribosomal protein L13
MRKTKYIKQEGKWVLIDAKDKVLGRLATRIAKILQGKHKASYTPNFISGDNVVVINAKHIRVTGKKMDDKVYQKYTGYPSGRKDMVLKRLQEKNPSRIVTLAVKGMLPKTVLGRQMLKNLKVYSESEHKHQAQKPQTIEV